MTVQTATHRHLPARNLALTPAGATLAAGAAFGLTQLLSADGTVVTPEQSGGVVTGGARDSWAGRLEPAPAPGPEHGVRDSWMPPGVTG